MPEIEVALGLDEPLLLRGAEAMLSEAEDCTVVAAVVGPEALLRSVRELRPHVTLADVQYHRADHGYIPSLQEVNPEGAVVVLVDHDEDQCVLRSAFSESRKWTLSEEALEYVDECCMLALRGKARGCLPRTTGPDGLLAAVRTAAAGQIAAGPWASARWLQRRLRARRGELAHVTAREMEVIRLVAEGLSNKAIASELGIQEQTIKNHLARVMRKLDVANRVELALLATREHLVG